MHCQSSDVQDPSFVGIGMATLISRRKHREVPIAPGGTLSDYVPFYFTPWSIMMLNIKTGRNEVIKRANEEIVIVVSSIHRLVESGIPFVFTNGHAYLAETDYFDSVDDLDKIDWALLQSRNFAHNDADLGKQGRYQAEALVHGHVPVEALLGIACYNQGATGVIADQVQRSGLDLIVKSVPKWYF